MRILFVSHDLIAGDLPWRLKKEGHDVKLYVDVKEARHNLDNLIIKVNDWRKELPWVGKEGLIVFDDVRYGKIQDKLREEGYTVFGGSEQGERLETDREFGQQVFREAGIKTVPLRDFFDVQSAIDFVKKHPGKWVVKQNNHSDKSLTHTGMLDDGSDVINMLENHLKKGVFTDKVITLQEVVEGIEMGVGRYFNGNDWVGPVEINFEHTRFFPGDVGPTTSEMGTLAWYENDENNKLFQDTLAKLKPFLQKVNFRGDIAIDCIVNRKGAWPLEATARFGTPIIHLQEEIHLSPWGEFLHAVASGKQYDLKYKKGYGIVVLLAVPPFPYTYKLDKHSAYNTDIHFSPDMTDEDHTHLHFEEIASRGGNTKKKFYISDSRGYLMYVTGVASSIEMARNRVYRVIRKIHVPHMFYRHDIGLKYMKKDYTKLKELGYISKEASVNLEDYIIKLAR